MNWRKRIFRKRSLRKGLSKDVRVEKMTTVTMFNKTLTVPEITSASEIQKHRRQIEERSKLIRTGKRKKTGRWRWLSLSRRETISAKERFMEMERIIGDYDAIMSNLVESRQAYETFFFGIAQIVEQGVAEQLAWVRTAEEKRRALVEEAIKVEDADLQHMATAREEDLRSIVRAFGQSALLVFKKIDLHRTAFEHLIEDQKIQRKVLHDLEKKLKAYQRMYELDEEIARLRENVHTVVNVALNFEKNLRDHLGPVQVLLEKVLQADNELHMAVVEIQVLAQIMTSETIDPDLLPDLDARDKSLLNFLIRSHLKRSRLEQALTMSILENRSFVDEELEPGGPPAQQGTVSDAVNNVLWLLETQLNRMPQPPHAEAIAVGLSQPTDDQ